MRRFVGFYWTLQVAWAGFVELSTNIDEASRQSRTIAYQRALAQRHVREAKGELVDEIAFLELSADRGTEHGAAAIWKASETCRAHGATLLWVDFATIGWRDHFQLAEAVRRIETDGIDTIGLSADELVGFPMRDDDPLAIPAGCPEQHFAQWKTATVRWRAKRDRTTAVELCAALEAIPEGYGRNTRIADRLNERLVPTKTDGPNRRWSGDLVREALQALDEKESEDRC